MMRVATSIVAASLALTSCHDFRKELTADGRCGNAVVEPKSGEDCDTFGPAGTHCGDPGTEHACLFTCKKDGSIGCPTGWFCGLDEVCRAPSAQFEDPVVIPLGANELRAGDFDGDGREDLIAFSTAEITVGYGDAEAKFARTVPFRLAAYEAPAIGDLNGDGLMDVAIPQPGGVLIATGQRNRRLSPVAIPREIASPDMTSLRAVAVRSVAPYLRHLAVSLYQQPGGPTVSVLGASAGTDAEAARAAMSGMNGMFVAHIGVADLDGGGTADEMAVAIEGGDQVVVLTPECTGMPSDLACTVAVRAAVQLPAGYHNDRSGTFLADADGDGAIDLLISALGPEGVGIVVARGDGLGGLGPAIYEQALTDGMFCNDCPLAGAVMLDVGDLNGDGRADFLSEEGAYTMTSTSPLQVTRTFHSSTPWRNAIFANLNGDDRLDIAGVRPTGLDILISADHGLFNTRQAPLAAAPSALSAGDFDGDLYPDLALVEGEGTVSVLFGGAESTTPVAELDRVTSIETMLADDGDGISDLLVTSSGPVDAPRMEIVQFSGSSARRLIAPLDFQGHLDALAAAYMDDDRKADLLIASSGNAGGQVNSRWLSHGASLFSDEIPEQIELTPGSPCANELARAHIFQHADLDGDGDEELIELAIPPASGPDPGLYALRVLDVHGEVLECTELEPAQDVSSLLQLSLVDLDGDGHLDAVVGFDYAFSFHTRPDISGFKPALVIWWGKAGAPYFEATPFVKHFGEQERSMALITAAELDGDPARELVFYDGSGVGVAEVSADRQINIRADRVPLDRGVGSIHSIQRIDADGDGLDDIAVGTADELFLIRQRPCTAQRMAAGQCERRSE